MNPTQQYIEDFGLFAEQIGLTRMAGRILAWLLICDPPHQTMHELVDALQTSKSSISTTTRLLITFWMLEWVSLPGAAGFDRLIQPPPGVENEHTWASARGGDGEKASGWGCGIANSCQWML